MKQNVVKVDLDIPDVSKSISVGILRRHKFWAAVVIATLMFPLAMSTGASKVQWREDADSRKADYIFMEAQRQNALDNEDAYFELLNRAYELAPSNSDVGFYLGYFKLALSNSDSVLFHQGYGLMRDHFKKSPEDFYATYLYGNINEKIGNRNEALKVWATLDSLFPEKTEIAFKYAETLGATNDVAEVKHALEIYNRIETAEGKNIPISTRKIRSFLVLRDTMAIVGEINALLQSSPRSSEYSVFAADVYSIFHQKDSALYYYNRACELDSTNGLAYYSRANFYKEQGDSVAYDREVFRALKQESLDLESKLGLLTNYIRALYEDMEQQPRIQDLFGVLLEQHPHERDIHDLYCSYLVAIKDYRGAAEQAGYALDIDPSGEDRWRGLMSLYMQAEDYEQAAKEGERALHYHPESAMIYLMLATNYNQMRQYDTAISYLDKSLAYTEPDDYEMQSQVLCTIGDTYYSKESTDSAFMYYDRALELNPGNLLALNNCAYYLACEGKDLERAERMSAITIKEEPENDTSLDTYAWVLFKMKKYDRAQYYIDEAIKYSDKPSAELYHHAGDIYFMMGEPERALDFWKEALEMDSDDELLQRKVKYKTYFYK